MPSGFEFAQYILHRRWRLRDGAQRSKRFQFHYVVRQFLRGLMLQGKRVPECILPHPVLVEQACQLSFAVAGF
ncbi:hypothetical protein D3C81_1248710 [compost metagenome]